MKYLDNANDVIETAAQLAGDPELRKKVEIEIKAKLPPDFSFHIDEGGIGHLWLPLKCTRTYG